MMEKGTTLFHVLERESLSALMGFEIGSRAIGVNPIGMYLGTQESILPGAHFDIVLPGDGIAHGGAGGAGKVPGDYLFRDQGSFGNLNGLWGIMRVD